MKWREVSPVPQLLLIRKGPSPPAQRCCSSAGAGDLLVAVKRLRLQAGELLPFCFLVVLGGLQRTTFCKSRHQACSAASLYQY